MGRYRFLNSCFLFLINCGFAFHLTAGTVHVGKEGHTNSIAGALQTVEVGDSVIVHEGVYHETLVITIPVVLKGVGSPVIDGGNQVDVVSIFADSVVVEGFIIANSGKSSLKDYCGLKINKGVAGVVVNNNIFTDNSIGIFIQAAEDCRITNNRINTSLAEGPLIGNAIHCWKSKNLAIEGNHIRRHRDGIYLEFVSNSIIRHNNVAKCLRYGLHFMFSNEDDYLYNIFRENGAGVAVMFSSHINMLYNTFDNNKGGASYGLLLKDISYGKIAGNRFTRNTVGIFMDGGLSLTLQENVFSENGWALRLMASSVENSFTRNNFLGNTFDVITNGASEKNYFSENYWDKYKGYDLNRDGIGDVPYHPLSLFAVISEYTPAAMLFFRSFLVNLLEQAERIIPTVTPRNFADNKPAIRQYAL
ncbi:nitrous oxide reductase family maturation protein NosD [uncultured Proteiniphilum sp.]|uniref:nitrous oxide reductase family maturation protein NosD n=1 Tax=uncultured Proteiniphilum sp. TaxID=497637 RepID=UPI00263233BE|nr:nitrous oxide reductase family maturation protein NosD [uncultured Proteiniphilum sp.]